MRDPRFICTLILFGTLPAPPAAAEDAAVPKPAWVTRGSHVERSERGPIYYGVGSASGLKSPELALSIARSRAFGEIGKLIETSVVVKETPEGRSITTHSAVTYSGGELVDTWRDPADGTVWGLAVYDEGEFKAQVEAGKRASRLVLYPRYDDCRGDGDGRISPGERGRIVVWIHNRREEDVAGIELAVRAPEWVRFAEGALPVRIDRLAAGRSLAKEISFSIEPESDADSPPRDLVIEAAATSAGEPASAGARMNVLLSPRATSTSTLTDVTCNAGGWCSHSCWNPSRLGVAADAIHGLSSDDLWVAGGSSISHFDGVAWTPSWSGESRLRLRDVFAVSARDVWAVGTGGTMLHFDGSAWAKVDVPTDADLYAIGGRRANELWATGDRVILRWNGKTWRSMRNPSRGPISGVLARSSSEVHGVGVAGTTFRFDGREWAYVPAPKQYALNAIWGAPGGEIWAVGQRGELVKEIGWGWARVKTGTESSLHDLFGFSRRDIYAVGAAGTILHFDGARWRRTASGTAEPLRAIWGASPRDLWILVDRKGQVLRKRAE